jgi:hypothetical protein
MSEDLWIAVEEIQQCCCYIVPICKVAIMQWGFRPAAEICQFNLETVHLGPHFGRVSMKCIVQLLTMRVYCTKLKLETFQLSFHSIMSDAVSMSISISGWISRVVDQPFYLVFEIINSRLHVLVFDKDLLNVVVFDSSQRVIPIKRLSWTEILLSATVWPVLESAILTKAETMR